MKTYIKLFEDFIKEEDPLADILGDTGKEDGKEEDKKDKKEEDPIKKLQDAEKKKKDKKEDNFDEFMDKKVKKLEEEFEKHPEIKEEIGKEILDAVKSKDRVKIHNAANDLIYLQVKYEKAGETDKVQQITPIKELVDDLDRSYTNSKMM
jgi:hypothetical protein